MAGAIAQVYEVALPYGDEADLSAALDAALPVYRNARLGEVTGGVLTCAAPVFAPVPAGAALVAPTPCADDLMNLMDSRMP